ncbi:MAG: TonB C-terminal domain-containing protein [Betaproteobacteria bacterium]
MEAGAQRRLAIILAVLMHLLLAAFLLVGLKWKNQEPEPVQAELWQASDTRARPENARTVAQAPAPEETRLNRPPAEPVVPPEPPARAEPQRAEPQRAEPQRAEPPPAPKAVAPPRLVEPSAADIAVQKRKEEERRREEAARLAEERKRQEAKKLAEEKSKKDAEKARREAEERRLAEEKHKLDEEKKKLEARKLAEEKAKRDAERKAREAEDEKLAERLRADTISRMQQQIPDTRPRQDTVPDKRPRQETVAEARPRVEPAEPRAKPEPNGPRPKPEPADTRAKAEPSEQRPKPEPADARAKAEPAEQRPKPEPADSRPRADNTEPRAKQDAPKTGAPGGAREGNVNQGQSSGVGGTGSSADAGYAARIRSAIRANTVFNASGLVGNPQARFLVTLSPSCEVLQVRLEASSGNKAWDEAAERAIARTSPFPRPPSGPCDRYLEISHRPREVVL